MKMLVEFSLEEKLRVSGRDGLKFDSILGMVLFMNNFVDLSKGASTNFFFNDVLFQDLFAYVGENDNLPAYYFYFSW